MGKLTDKIAAFGGRLMAEFARHSPQTAVAAPPQIQSVDQLATILLGGDPNASQVNRALTVPEARRMWWRWQYAAVTALAEAVMMTPWRIEVRKRDTWKEDDGHPLVRLLNHVNQFMTGPELIYWTVVEGQLIGQSFLRIARNRAGEPAELWPLMGRVEPVPDPKKVVAQWKETIKKKNGGEAEVFHDLEDVVYIRLPKPGDLMGGYGPVQAAGAAIRLDQQIIESNWAAIKNGVIPFAVATIKPEAGKIDAQQREQLRTEIDEKYAGAKKTGGTMVHGDLLDIKFPPHKPREMGYPEASGMARDDILGALRVPAAILGLSKDVNRSSAEGMEYVFAKWRVTPLLHLYYSRLQQDLVLPNYGEDVRIVYDSPVPADRQQETQERDMRLRQGSLTINEDRELEGREPVEWGHEPWMQVSLVQPSMGRDEPGEQAQQFVEQAKGPRGFSREVRAKLARAAARGQTRLREKLTRVYRGIFRDVKTDVLAAWDESSEAELRAHDWVTQDLPPKVDQVLDVQRLKELIEGRTNSTTKWGVLLGGEFEAGLNGGDDRPWNDGLDAIDRYAAQYGHTHDLDMAETTRREMMDTVAAGIKENESWDQLRLRVAGLFDEMMESRAANIATTETTKLYGAGSQAFRDEYGITHKQWIASFVNTRDTHAAIDGKVVKNGEYFEPGADRMLFPGDGSLAKENCNCSCCAVGVVK